MPGQASGSNRSGSANVAPLRVGLIGCGFATVDRHLPALARCPSAEAVAAADLDPEALRRAADLGVPSCHDEPQALLDDPAVEAVAVCVPPAAHLELTLRALEAGKHVLVEKPLAHDLDAASALLEGARVHDRQVAVGFNLRHHRLVRRMRDLVRAGAVGEVTEVQTVFSDSMADGGDPPEWRRRRALGGGALMDKGVHHFDLWRFLTGLEVDEVGGMASADLSDDETATVSARFTGGAHAGARVSDRGAVEHTVTVRGDAGSITASLYRADSLRHEPAGEVPATLRARALAASQAARELGPALRSMRSGGDFAASYAGEWDTFARAVREGGPTPSTLEDGHAALAIALAAAESADRATLVTPRAHEGATA